MLNKISAHKFDWSLYTIHSQCVLLDIVAPNIQLMYSSILLLLMSLKRSNKRCHMADMIKMDINSQRDDSECLRIE